MSSLDAAYFEALYARDPDPWRFADSPYEREKYADTLALLRPRYVHAAEIGCSIGILTRQLAERCDALVAVDAAAAPLAQARAHCADAPHVTFAHRSVPASWPDGRFDLIVLSEVLYYFDADDRRRVAERVAESLAPGGDCVLIHWIGPTDYPATGDAATEGFIAALPNDITVVQQARRHAYRADLLRRAA